MQPVKQSWILAGGFLSALAASLCCIGPLLALAAGAGSFAAAGWFERWRPAFLAGTVVLLTVAWVLTLRARRVASQDPTCAASRSGRWALGVLICSSVLVGAVAMFPQITQITARQPLAATGATVQGSVLRVRIPSMDCVACAHGIEGTLKRVGGVRSAVVRYEKKEAEVVFDPVTISVSALIAKIDATGFKAEPIN